MPCNQTLAGIARDCTPSMGGIVAAYIANRDDIEGITVTSDKVSGFTLATGVTTPFHLYNFRKGTGSMTSTLNVDQAAGSNFVSTDLLLQFSRMDTTKRIEIAALAVNELWVVVKEANGLYWLLGAEEPVVSSAGTGQTGTARADGNYYQITLQDNSSTFPIEVNVGSGAGQVDLDSLVA